MEVVWDGAAQLIVVEGPAHKGGGGPTTVAHPAERVVPKKEKQTVGAARATVRVSRVAQGWLRQYAVRAAPQTTQGQSVGRATTTQQPKTHHNPPQPTNARTNDYALGEGQSQLDMSSSYKYVMLVNDARLAGILPLKLLLLRSL